MTVRALKSVVPKRTKEWGRRILFNASMSRLQKCLAVGHRPSPKLIWGLQHGWGNLGWSAKPEFLLEVLDYALSAGGPILECGSGLSTIIMGLATRNSKTPVLALEHIPSWADRVQSILDDYRLDHVSLKLSTISPQGRFDWYDLPRDLPDFFSIVICDGPPSQTRGGRYGLLPLMRSRLTGDSVVLLDDLVRSSEQETVSRWQEEFNMTAELKGEPPFAVLRFCAA